MQPIALLLGYKLCAQYIVRDRTCLKSLERGRRSAEEGGAVSMVQVLVTVRPGRGHTSHELLECTMETSIAEVKRRALAGAAGFKDEAAAAEAALRHDLTFLGQQCQDDKRLADYGVNQEWIAQVAGFVLQPRR